MMPWRFAGKRCHRGSSIPVEDTAGRTPPAATQAAQSQPTEVAPSFLKGKEAKHPA